ncbi:LLM class flavin-dependent oxidoreductase [Belnapia rosea]|uniref:Flavin-dependent oxidoreductase, luciferase family (Includes alkanesulfonate monooxygenase SsuD and methylene tetrahydromethanopterin reductase) n=1 Tax=Belnapia rosea TaxID=938405 RepID=A0A1G6UFP1_9PROT|nr:LLM class flavin-dependent oxidoreductase [Belnapia rosea]SDD40064.1 Flavin-dependent oxidoreductase, luciferase family (includes alkanesulfonate monooxygenase SsuD and methylene tetrahydromethanopterin reductase) [Belnapia rosea]
MKFSVMFSFVAPEGGLLSHRESFAQMAEVLPLAESLGYHGVHITEHHFQEDGWLPNPLLALAMAAGITKRMRLVTNILVSTLYHPVQLLEDLATLDNLSNGRLGLGTAPGYVREEFAGRGLAYEERFQRHEEIIDFLQQAWRNPADIGFEGRFVRVPHLPLQPRPVQAELPIWYGVSGPKMLERAARRGVPVTASPRHTTAELQEHFARYEAAAARFGYVPTERPVIREALVLEDRSEAVRYGGPGTSQLFGLYGKKSASGERALRDDAGALVTEAAPLAFEALASRFLVGDPASAREGVQALIEALHPTELVLRMQMPDVPTEVLARSLRTFAERVMPHFA